MTRKRNLKVKRVLSLVVCISFIIGLMPIVNAGGSGETIVNEVITHADNHWRRDHDGIFTPAPNGIRVQGDGTNNNSRFDGYVQFNLSTIPETQSINTVKLKMYKSTTNFYMIGTDETRSYPYYDPINIQVDGITDDWTESDATATKAATTTASNLATVPMIYDVNDWYEFDITNFALQKHGDNKKISLKLVSLLTFPRGNWISFDSKENISGNAPRLIVGFDKDILMAETDQSIQTAEISRSIFDFNKAQTYVDLFPEGTEKAAFQSRLDAIELFAIKKSLIPTADRTSRLDGNISAHGNGGLESIRVQNDGTNPNNNRYYGFLKYDLQNIPNTQSISSAKLQVFKSNTVSVNNDYDGPINVQIDAITDDWTENDINASLAATVLDGWGDMARISFLFDENRWYNIDVKNFVLNRMNNDKKVNFRLTSLLLNPRFNYIFIDSKENPSGNYPGLVFEFDGDTLKNESIQAVEQAETTQSLSDLDEAQRFINLLPDNMEGDLNNTLQLRVDTVRNSFYNIIGETPVFKSKVSENWEVITGLVSGDMICEVAVSNPDSISRDSILIVALFNGNTIEKVVFSELKGLASGANNTITTPILQIPSDLTDVHVKAFLWNSFTGMHPLRIPAVLN